MKHEIDLKNYAVHTDLALEVVEGETGYHTEIREENEIKITKVIIEKGFHAFGKEEGTYTTLEFQDFTDHVNRKNLEKVFTKELKEFLHLLKIGKDAKALIVGLGNHKSTPDSLGPLSVSNILVTSHLFFYGEVEKGIRSISAFLPGVTGETGMETSELVKSVIKKMKPDFIIVIDSLASRSIDRLCHTIQITDTGIHPGSGIGNERKEISASTLGIPVIAVGVPTVVDAVTIVSDTMHYLYKHLSYTKQNLNNPKSKLIVGGVNYLKEEVKGEEKEKEKWFGLLGSLKEEEIKKLIFEVLTPIGYNLMVTPKEIDFMVQDLGILIGHGINYALHENHSIFN